MGKFGVVGFEKVLVLFFAGKDFVAIFAKVFARKGDETSFGIWLHSEIGTGGNLESDFHVISLKVLFGEMRLHREGIGKGKELVNEVKFLVRLHDMDRFIGFWKEYALDDVRKYQGSFWETKPK